MFSSLDMTFSHSVKLGNNNKMEVAGKGAVKLMLGGILYIVGDVYFVPELKNNLLSVGQLPEKGLTVLFQEEACNIYHPQRGLIVKSIMSANRMFTILSEPPETRGTREEKNTEVTCLNTNGADLSKLWHERYGHLSYKGLHTLQNKDMVHGLPKFPASTVTCVDCLNRKQTRNSIPKQCSWRSTQPLELVHSDICGPISPISNSGKRYFLSFIDDYSRKAWAYLLAKKSDTLNCFKIFKSMVEK